MVIFDAILLVVHWGCVCNSFSHFWSDGTKGPVQEVSHRQSLHKNVDISIATVFIFALNHL